MVILLAEPHAPPSLSPWSQVLRLSFTRSVVGSHPLQWKAHLTLPPPSMGIAPIGQGCISPAWLGKRRNSNTKHNVIEMTKSKDCREKVTFQRPSNTRRTESSFCSRSESELNAIGAVSQPLSRDDGTWQAG